MDSTSEQALLTLPERVTRLETKVELMTTSFDNARKALYTLAGTIAAAAVLVIAFGPGAHG